MGKCFNFITTALLLVLRTSHCNAQSVSNVIGYYESSNCGTTPNRVDLQVLESCTAGCSANLDWGWKSGKYFCPDSDYKQTVWTAFGGAAYLLKEAYDSNCETTLGASAFLASGNCDKVIMYVEDWGYAVYTMTQLESDGSVSSKFFTDSECTSSLDGSVPVVQYITAEDTSVDASSVNSNSCDGNGIRWSYYSAYGSAPSSSTSNSTVTNQETTKSEGNGTNVQSSSGNADHLASDDTNSSLQSTTPSISISTSTIGIVAGGFAALLVVLGFILHRRRSKRQSNEYLTHSSPASELPDTGSLTTRSLEKGPQGQSGLWYDDVITAKRLARKDILIEHLLSAGAFGEVYAGVYNDKRVAVKMLTPETRGLMSHVNNFLAEAKLTASMDHPRVVHFIGVAWDSLSDLCVVMEYMEGGDLRTLLTGYETTKHPVGIDREKATIALHVCHALTYLHSLSPPVIHRDLKSRNILLNHAMEAKLIDFGISRERLDQTMTAGVGTSLWMAPEVMLGEKYDDKADIFSFGVVLSELDVHTLPYAQAKENNRDPSGRRLPDAIILQQVAMGRLRVSFSECNSQSVKELGAACVSVDPSMRPTAAEALYKLQVAMANEIA